MRGKDTSYIVKGIHIHVKPGEIHALLGPNGSGKTTLLNALAGHPNYLMEGTALFNGKVLSKLTPEKRFKEGLMLLFQQPPSIEGLRLYDFLKMVWLTQKELDDDIKNIRLFNNDLKKALGSVGVKEDLIYRSFNDKFSGGEKKRIELLQLELFKPKLALIDEVDAGLDVQALELLKSRLKEHVKAGNSALLVTHNFDVLNHVKPSRVYIMLSGKIIETGDLEVVKRAHRAWND